MKNDQISRIEFPEVSEVDIVFGGYPKKWFDTILKEHKCLPGWKHKANNLFFSGGTVPLNKELPPEYLNKGLRILKAILGSFEPKHEHKEHVAGVILENLCRKDKK